MMGNTSRLSGYPNTGIRWRPKSNREFTACNCDGTIKWYDREKETTVGHYETEAGYLCVDYNGEGDWSAFGNSEHEIHIFDEGTKKFQQKYLAGTLDCVYPNHTNRIFCVKGLKSDRNLFFTGGWDDTVRLWDVRVPKIYIRKFVGPTVTADSLDLQGSTLLAGNYAIKNNLQLWDFSSGELIENLDVKQTK